MKIDNKIETLGFQTEVKQLLHLVTNSLYSNKEIFLRELISNSSDAIDKLRFKAITNINLYEGDSDLKIWITFDSDNKTITIEDNGIGMNKEEVIANLGTIAKSGTKEFLSLLSDEQSKNNNLIGQFGVGFYSSFIVANKVIVETRSAGLNSSMGVMWESEGLGEFTIRNIDKKNRGTKIILYLKKDEIDLLDHWRLKHIITKYSDYVPVPIIMQKPNVNDDKTKLIEEEIVNKAVALWTLSKNEIKEEEYIELYKHISNDTDSPLLWSHNKVEGKIEYISLLYIPRHAPYNFGLQEKNKGLKLYVQRTFILEGVDQLLPNYLRFVQGIIDAKDLPLNVSRELIQNNKIVSQIRAGIVKRILEMLNKYAISDSKGYEIFWNAFGNVIKEGVIEDPNEKDAIMKLARFISIRNNDTNYMISIDDYIGRMKKDQDKIFYIIHDGDVISCNPYLEIFKKSEIEVLYLNNKIDEWWIVHCNDYQGKNFQSITNNDENFNKFIESNNIITKEYDDFTQILDKIRQILKDDITEVRLSKRLINFPACVIIAENSVSFNMQKILSTYGHKDLPKVQHILELNPEHKIIQNLKKINENDDLLNKWVNIIYNQALMLAGGKINNITNFINATNELLKDNFIT